MKLGLNGRFLSRPITGVERVARELVRRLPARVETVLFVPRGVRPDPGLGATTVEEGRLGGRLWEQLELPRSAAAHEVDVLLHPANSAPRIGGPHVLILHDVTPLTRPSDFTVAFRLWARWAYVGAARSAAAVITVSRHSAAEIARTVGLPLDSIDVVHQGVGPLDAPADPTGVARVRERYDLPERYFLGVGRGDPRKGLEFLSTAYARWTASDPVGVDVPLVLVGQGTGRVHREAKPSAPSLVLGRVTDEELRALYTGACALLYPSHEEGFGRVPLEAMACGTRVVAAPYPAAHEVLGDAADLVPLQAERWVEALTRVLDEDAEARAERIARGIRWASAFSWDAAVESALSICERVVERSRGSAAATRAAPASPTRRSG